MVEGTKRVELLDTEPAGQVGCLQLLRDPHHHAPYPLLSVRHVAEVTWGIHDAFFFKLRGQTVCLLVGPISARSKPMLPR